MDLVFNSQYWIDADKGLFDFAALFKIFSKKRPEWADDLKYLLSRESMLRLMTPKTDTVEFMKELRTTGYKIYLLSNFSKEDFSWIDETYTFLKDVDGRIISSHVRLIKPDHEIYKLLLKRYSLKPSESVFFDDIAANVQAAKDLGIHAIQFTDVSSIKKQFDKLIEENK